MTTATAGLARPWLLALAFVGVMAGGVETPISAVPTTGTATYNGTTLGVGATGATAFALSGNAQIVANFTNQAVTTTFSNIVTQNIVGGAMGTLPDLTGSATLRGNKYQGPIGNGAFVGTTNGTLYGPNAEETAGVWNVSNGFTHTTAMGSFGAKR